MYCSTYEGDVVNGVRHGIGVLHSVGLGITYSGQWVYGKQHGRVRNGTAFVSWLSK